MYFVGFAIAMTGICMLGFSTTKFGQNLRRSPCSHRCCRMGILLHPDTQDQRLRLQHDRGDAKDLRIRHLIHDTGMVSYGLPSGTFQFARSCKSEQHAVSGHRASGRLLRRRGISPSNIWVQWNPASISMPSRIVGLKFGKKMRVKEKEENNEKNPGLKIDRLRFDVIIVDVILSPRTHVYGTSTIPLLFFHISHSRIIPDMMHAPAAPRAIISSSWPLPICTPPIPYTGICTD